MMPNWRAPLRWPRSLKTRLLILLTVALLPLGLIAVIQARGTVVEAERLAARDILARTGNSAREQAAILRRAYGSADGLGSMAATLGPQNPTCSAIMRRFVDARDGFAFAGFVSADGSMICFSGDGAFDYSNDPAWIEFLENPRPIATIIRNGDVSQTSVILALVPVFDPISGALVGGQGISIPQGLTDLQLNAGVSQVDLALINEQGMFLAASTGIDDVDRFSRLGITPSELAIPADGLLVQTRSADGTTQPAALVPLIRGSLYVVGLWSDDPQALSMSVLDTATPALPMLMWLASLVVAFLAVDRLILNPLSRIARHMASVRFGTPQASFAGLEYAPAEIEQIVGTFNHMVDRVEADRAKLEETVEEKELLLREIHHRVKNNLQLILSILNMQMRGVKSEDARRILKRVQDRVMSLSTIHKALYLGTRVDMVRTDLLLQEIVSGVLNIGLESNGPVQTRIALRPVMLDADQSVPVALLVSEALTNATKYVGQPPSGIPSIGIEFYEDQAGQVHLVVENTRGILVHAPEHIDGSGLGAPLIEAFASQIGSEPEIVETDEFYRLSLTFSKTAMAQPGR